jgi:choline dehydrogenase-like flavoprotein
MTTDRYDVIIIGSGAGGGTFAHRLAPSGKRILILERRRLFAPRARKLERRGGLWRGALA